MIPNALRRWFVVHFVADYAFAIPLFIAPVWTLELLGWQGADPIATRMVAAALAGVGGESLLGRNGGVEYYLAMLNLKVIWSSVVIAGQIIALALQAQIDGKVSTDDIDPVISELNSGLGQAREKAAAAAEAASDSWGVLQDGAKSAASSLRDSLAEAKSRLEQG